MDSFAKDVDKFLGNIQEEVVEVQKTICEDILDTLFIESPHFGVADWANSQYDASHKIAINEAPMPGPEAPTQNPAVSKAIVDAEKNKLERIHCGDIVRVGNSAEHALEVEYGKQVTSSWKRDGYHPFYRTENYIRGKYRDVIR